jgi:hypothetical protein
MVCHIIEIAENHEEHAFDLAGGIFVHVQISSLLSGERDEWFKLWPPAYAFTMIQAPPERPFPAVGAWSH